jgi:hypothetical protein
LTAVKAPPGPCAGGTPRRATRSSGAGQHLLDQLQELAAAQRLDQPAGGAALPDLVALGLPALGRQRQDRREARVKRA